VPADSHDYDDRKLVSIFDYVNPETGVNDSLVTPEGQLDFFPFLEEIEKFVEGAARRTNRQLVKLMLHKYALLGHCGAVRKYLFLAQGDFIEVFLDLVNSELKKDAKREVFRHNIRSIVDQAIRLSNAQYHKPEFLDRLDVTLAVASLGEVGWDIFSFDYAITTPLHVVLS